MITRRGFMISSGGALAALSLAGVAKAAPAGDGFVSVASPARPLATGLKGATHHVLTGDRLADIRTLETLVAETEGVLRLSLDSADEVLFDVARIRAVRPAVQVSAAAGVTDFRLTSVAGV